MQVFTIACLITFLWLVFGYSLSFSPSQSTGQRNEVYGNADRLWLQGMMTHTTHMLAPTIPEVYIYLYHLFMIFILYHVYAHSYIYMYYTVQ